MSLSAARRHRRNNQKRRANRARLHRPHPIVGYTRRDAKRIRRAYKMLINGIQSINDLDLSAGLYLYDDLTGVHDAPGLYREADDHSVDAASLASAIWTPEKSQMEVLELCRGGV